MENEIHGVLLASFSVRSTSTVVKQLSLVCIKFFDNLLASIDIGLFKRSSSKTEAPSPLIHFDALFVDPYKRIFAQPRAPPVTSISKSTVSPFLALLRNFDVIIIAKLKNRPNRFAK